MAQLPPELNTGSIVDLIDVLGQIPEREPISSELGVLLSIYGDDAVQIWRPGNFTRTFSELSAGTIRYDIVLNLPPPHEDVTVKVLVSLPPTYPSSSPPQLQLLSRYIGAYGVDSALFGSIIRTFISSNGVEWSADTVCVFDGLQSVVDRCNEWYENRLTTGLINELSRPNRKEAVDIPLEDSINVGEEDADIHTSPELGGIKIYEAEPINDRRSVFVGRACEITDPSQVPLVLSYLLSNRRISRAAHPVIHAWRCQVQKVLHQDNDDDGETAAGGRIAHLLQILEVNNVLVIVTRYFGGIHLGSDRFKHINQAARSALEAGGFLENSDKCDTGASRGKRR